MEDKGVQVVVGRKRGLRLEKSVQTIPEASKEERSTQCEVSFGSYGSNKRHAVWRYEDLMIRMLDKEMLIAWLMSEGMLTNVRLCPLCSEEMNLVRCTDRSDGFRWECRKQEGGKRHRADTSIRKGSWFEQSNMTLEEILKYTYWWCRDLDQVPIKHELGLSSSTIVDWDSFCREVCEIVLLESSEKIGGQGKTVEIDESKFGKRKHHRGHHVEGQWVFDGIETESRNCFMVAVEKRDEGTLLPIIEKWIEPGTTIVSDCWKAYSNLEKHGYVHRTVNHSKEFRE